MKSLNNKEDESRTQEIRMIWKQHQWLYVIIGFIIGLLFTALTQVHTIDFFLNLIPEALGISFGVFVVDRLYRHWERQRLLKLIKKEIISNLSHMMTKREGYITPIYKWVMPIREAYGLSGIKKTTSVTGQQIKLLWMYLIVGVNTSQLRTDFIDSALTSDTLLLSGNIDLSDRITIHESLLNLSYLINKRKSNGIDELLKKPRLEIDALISQVGIHQEYPLSNNLIYVPMHCIDLDINIISWSQNIIASINSGNLAVTVPKLQPIAPLEKVAKEISEETPQPSDIEEWIPNWKLNW
jgi:hypothetical protein